MASACQDELGHAQVMYRLLEDFGYDTHEFLFERDPEEWRTFQMLEFPHEDYIETVVSMCYGDRDLDILQQLTLKRIVVMHHLLVD